MTFKEFQAELSSVKHLASRGIGDYCQVSPIVLRKETTYVTTCLLSWMTKPFQNRSTLEEKSPPPPPREKRALYFKDLCPFWSYKNDLVKYFMQHFRNGLMNDLINS